MALQSRVYPVFRTSCNTTHSSLTHPFSARASTMELCVDQWALFGLTKCPGGSLYAFCGSDSSVVAVQALPARPSGRRSENGRRGPISERRKCRPLSTCRPMTGDIHNLE